MAIIYKTTCLVNNKIYIGQSKNNKNSYLGSGRIFLKAIKKYGRDNFIKEILIEGDFTQEEIDNFEISFIKEHNSTNSNIGYNIRHGGNGNTDKTNRLIGKSSKNKIIPKDVRDKISKSKLGKKASAETKLNMSKSKIGNSNRKGKTHSDDDRVNISEGIKKYYEIEENRQKSSDTAKQRIKDGKCLEGVRIISSKENQIKATSLARLSNIKKVLIRNIETSEEVLCESLVECRKYFSIKSNTSIINCAKNNKIYRKKFILSYE